MQDAHKTSMAKTYGSGFDRIGLSEDHVRSFLAWWNGKSHFPVEGAEAPETKADDLPMAA
jgi:hypothetical protein